jgi:hypothetical protein
VHVYVYVYVDDPSALRCARRGEVPGAALLASASLEERTSQDLAACRSPASRGISGHLAPRRAASRALARARAARWGLSGAVTSAAGWNEHVPAPPPHGTV